MKYLGIDYGTKKVGLALSDDSGSLAFAHEIVANDDKLLEKIQVLCDSEGVDEIVVGESLDQKGEANQVQEAIDDLIGEISLTIGLPIHMERETFSSTEAKLSKVLEGESRGETSRTRSSGKNKKPVDDSAAALILQRFLDKQ